MLKRIIYNRNHYLDSSGSTSSISIEGLDLENSIQSINEDPSRARFDMQEQFNRELEKMNEDSFPDTIPSIYDSNGPYTIDYDGNVTLTCDDKTKSYSVDNGKTWIEYEGTITLKDGNYQLGSIKLRSFDGVYISSLPQISTPCKPISVTHHTSKSDRIDLDVIDLDEFKDIELSDKDLTELDTIDVEQININNKLTIECEVGPNMQVYHSIDNNTNWVIIPSNEFGKSSITFSNVEVTSYSIKVSPIRYDYDKMGPIFTYKV